MLAARGVGRTDSGSLGEMSSYLLDIGEVRPVDNEEVVWRPNFPATFYVIVLSGQLRLMNFMLPPLPWPLAL